MHDGVALSQDWRPGQLLTQAVEKVKGWQAAYEEAASWPDDEDDE